MDCRVLKLVIQSAHGLKDVNHVTTMKPYAIVSIRDNQNNLHSSEEKTPEDTGGASNPTWNSPVTFNNLDITKAKESNHELVVKLMSFRTDHWFRDKEIGEVRVSITKLLEGFGGKAKADAVVAEKQMSASVMTTDEKPQGTLVFSYKFESVTTGQKPARQKNSPTAQQNVRQKPEQPAGLGNQLDSKTVKGIVGTASNNIGLTSAVASDATAAPPPRAMRTRAAAAANQHGADDPSEGNNRGIAGTVLNTTGLTSASDAAAAPPSPAIQNHVAAADDPSEDNNEGNTTGLTSAAPPSPAIQTRVAAAVDQGGTADDPSEDNNEGNATGLTSASDAAAAPPSPTSQTHATAAVDHRGTADEDNNDEGEDEDDAYEDEGYEDEE
uniref:C2 domain-containing protein n=1 Tax=Quercus lobata TaxID=97700 RepID=A0A7N2LEN4_QUELO